MIAQLKLRANASHATRSDLALLSESSVSIDQQLRQLREEIQDLKKSLPAPDEEKKEEEEEEEDKATLSPSSDKRLDVGDVERLFKKQDSR